MREVAVGAHATAPPLLDAKETLAVVEWHQTAIRLVNGGQAGWKNLMTTGLDQLLAKLKPTTRQLLAPYAAVIRTLLQELK